MNEKKEEKEKANTLNHELKFLKNLGTHAPEQPRQIGRRQLLLGYLSALMQKRKRWDTITLDGEAKIREYIRSELGRRE